MVKECKKCGSKNLYLEPRIKGQDVMTADMVALKCKDCGVWLKWCPKDERKFYLIKPIDKWQKLKDWANYLCYFELLDKMQELEAEDEQI